MYRRLKPKVGGHTGKISTQKQGQPVLQEVTNQWVGPYIPFLLQQMNSHINVEICSSIKCIKYVFKCITKGSDQVVFQLQCTEQEGVGQLRVIDEIAQFKNVWCVWSSEAA